MELDTLNIHVRQAPTSRLFTNEPPHEEHNNLHNMRKQRRR